MPVTDCLPVVENFLLVDAVVLSSAAVGLVALVEDVVLRGSEKPGVVVNGPEQHTNNHQ